jgi:hypothetical protein
MSTTCSLWVRYWSYDVSSRTAFFNPLCPTSRTAPPALAESKNHGSSDAPWLIGLLVVVLLGLGMMMLRLRSGMRRRDPSDHFRQE